MGPSIGNLLALFVLLAPSTLPHAVVPNFSDLKIKTRRSGQAGSFVGTLYLKGAWQRQEYVYDKPLNSSFVSVSRCDDRKRIDLNDAGRLYAETLHRRLVPSSANACGPSRRVQRPVRRCSSRPTRWNTGERRKLGTYMARHVRITIKVEAGPGAAEPSSGKNAMAVPRSARTRLPGFKSANRIPPRELETGWAAAGSYTFQATGHGSFRFLLSRRPPRRPRTRGSITSTVELVEFSEASLNNALFDIPAVILRHCARRTAGIDLTKADTLANRVQVYWRS